VCFLMFKRCICFQYKPNNTIKLTFKSAHQLINNPTHFTENSNSIIDVIIVKHTHNVIYSFVSEPILPALTIYHCPIACVLKFAKLKTNNYKRHIWLYDKGDYDEYVTLQHSMDEQCNPQTYETQIQNAQNT